jgi:hypothetical protein
MSNPGDHQISGRTESPPNPGSFSCRSAGRRVAAFGGEAVEFVDELVGGNGAFDEPAEAFAGVLVDDGDDLDGSAVGGGLVAASFVVDAVVRAGRR